MARDPFLGSTAPQRKVSELCQAQGRWMSWSASAYGHRSSLVVGCAPLEAQHILHLRISDHGK